MQRWCACRLSPITANLPIPVQQLEGTTNSTFFASTAPALLLIQIAMDLFFQNVLDFHNRSRTIPSFPRFGFIKLKTIACKHVDSVADWARLLELVLARTPPCMHFRNALFPPALLSLHCTTMCHTHTPRG